MSPLGLLPQGAGEVKVAAGFDLHVYPDEAKDIGARSASSSGLGVGPPLAQILSDDTLRLVTAVLPVLSHEALLTEQ